MASCPSRIHHQLVSFFASNPHHHALSNASVFIRGTALLPNDDVLPTADASTECFEENLLLNGVLLPNSAHMSVSSLYQFLVLTSSKKKDQKCSLGVCLATCIRRNQALQMQLMSVWFPGWRLGPVPCNARFPHEPG
jgi:hypothetical protein